MGSVGMNSGWGVEVVGAEGAFLGRLPGGPWRSRKDCCRGFVGLGGGGGGGGAVPGRGGDGAGDFRLGSNSIGAQGMLGREK